MNVKECGIEKINPRCGLSMCVVSLSLLCYLPQLGDANLGNIGQRLPPFSCFHRPAIFVPRRTILLGGLYMM